MQNRTLALLKNWLMGRTTGADSGVETLEVRQMLSAALPADASYLDWGNSRVAAITGSYIVTFEEHLGNERAELVAREVATRLGVTVEGVSSIGRGGWAEIRTRGVVSKTVANRVVNDMSDVIGIEPNLLHETTRVPNDPQFNEQWGLRNTGQFIEGQLGTLGADISVEEAWDVTIGDRNVVVAVIDSGVDIDHPDLAPNLWVNPGEVAGNGLDDDGNGFIDDVNGWDFGVNDNNPNDDIVGHGTMVASAIGAVGNNNQGATGVAWNVQIMALKIATSTGGLSSAAIIGAHDYATMMRTEHGINLVASNNSYGLFAPEFYEDLVEGLVAERQAIERFIATGATFVAAAGNNGANNDLAFTSFPASYNVPGIISVAATTNLDTLAGFSNYGVQKVDVAAPGQSIWMAMNGGTYGYADGTSFASPIVAGIVALIYSIKPNASAVEVREALIAGSDPLPGLQGLVRSGGRVNAARTLQIIQTAGPVVRAVTPGPVVGQLLSDNTARNTVSVTFSRDIDASLLTTTAFSLRGNGLDNISGNGDDNVISASGITLSSDLRTVTITLNLASFSQQRLPIDQYTMVLAAAGFRDTSGNFLNGNTAGGEDYTYTFSVVPTTGAYEQNDTLIQATTVDYAATGSARFSGVTLGDGLSGQADVDIFKLDLPRGGLITLETVAQRLSVSSAFDSFLRLFDANGNELASNDQFAGNDSFIDFFVATGGIYYVGVSGFGNEDYDPTVSGAPVSQSRGVYDLVITVDLVDNDVVRYTSADNSPAGQTYPLPIPRNTSDTSGNTDAFIDITDTREILDINVRVALVHDYTSDLQISLISPSGTTVRLFSNRGANGDDLGTFDSEGNVLTYTLFDDEGAAAISAGAAPFTSSGFRPEQSLGLFDGQSAAGRWTLKINDTVPQNVGELVAWDMEFTFQNDIFGAFELNDTLTTAKQLTELSDPTVTTAPGTGAAQRQAFIGDGAFGSYDRDLFRFEAAAGGTLTVVVTPTGTLNAALRLMDSLGNQIILSNPAGTTSARIENYVFAFSGTFYIGVTDGNNIAYTPTVANDGSDVLAGTTGGYTLDLSIAAGVSDGGTTLAGDDVTAAINTTGTFGVGTTGLGFNGAEFLAGGSSIRQFIGGRASGYSFVNEGPDGANSLPFSLTAASDTFNQRLSTIADFRGMRVERVFSYGIDDSFIAIDIFFKNTTASTLTDVSWMEGFNPDPGLGLASTSNSTASTINDVDSSGKFATARFNDSVFQNGLTIGLAAPASDTRAVASVLTANQAPRDSAILLAAGTTDPNGTEADSQLAMSFDIGDIAAGQSTSIRYFIFLGSTFASVNALNTALNAGTGEGHLTADSANPTEEALITESTETDQSVPTLPYRQFFPEGFYGSNVYTFIPVTNPNNQATRVVIVARFEAGFRDGNGIEVARDQVLGDFVLPANSRDGLTLVTPELFEAGNTLLRARTAAPYAIELRSERPVAATFSHYDLNLVAGSPTAVGESFTTRIENTWTFGNMQKGDGHSEFITLYNPNDANIKVTATFYPSNGGAAVTVTRDIAALRRSGVAFLDFDGADPAILGLAAGTYGVVLTSPSAFIASVTKYDSNAGTAEGSVANAGAGSLTGAIAEGEIGLNGTAERIGVLNAQTTAATVIFSFIFTGGSTYRTSLEVPARSQRELVVTDLPNFPSGEAYGIFYESNVRVSVSMTSEAYGEAVSSATADKGYTLWGFGEGFRPGDNEGHPGVTDYLRLYNPASTETVVEITISYFGQAPETFRRVLAARRISEFNVDQFVSGARRASFQFYGLTVKSPTPIVAFMGHYDRAFPGAFGTMGTPLGLNATIS